MVTSQNATFGSPKLSKTEKAYKRALACVSMAPSSSSAYKKAKAHVANYDASVAAAKRGKPLTNSNSNNISLKASSKAAPTMADCMTPPRKKSTVAVNVASGVKSNEKGVLSPSTAQNLPIKKLMATAAAKVASGVNPTDERLLAPSSIKRDLLVTAQKTAAVQSPPSIRYANENKPPKATEPTFSDGGFEETVEVFHSPHKMVSSAFAKEHVKETKSLFYQCYPQKAEIDQEWVVWKNITWKYLTNHMGLALFVGFIFCFSFMEWSFKIARLFGFAN